MGEITNPVKFTSPTGDDGYRLLTLLSRTAPHQANLQQDYARIEVFATENKKAIEFNKWLEEKISDTYVHVDPLYHACPNVDYWMSVVDRGKVGLKQED